VKTQYRPVTPENRFDLVNSGAIDLECGSTTNNTERRKVAAFSPTMFVTGTKVLVRRGSGILNFRDLAGKTVVLTRGTVQETAVPKLAERQKIAAKFIFAGDHKESFEMLAAGKADAFANDDVQLHGMLAETKSAADFRVVGDFLTYADYALMFRKDDPEFAEVVERAFRQLAAQKSSLFTSSGSRSRCRRVRADLPMSPHLEELFGQGLPPIETCARVCVSQSNRTSSQINMGTMQDHDPEKPRNGRFAASRHCARPGPSVRGICLESDEALRLACRLSPRRRTATPPAGAGKIPRATVRRAQDPSAIR
jgi:hypothetical protein